MGKSGNNAAISALFFIKKGIALDTQTSKQIMEILSAMNARGKTVIVVTHDDTVAGYCKKIETLSDGEIISPEKAREA